MIGGAFRYNAENVRYHATPWLTGDGSTSSGTLLDRHGNPISSGKLKRVDSIHRTDWQGRQLLYPTARTNLTVQSQNFTAANWAKTNCTSASGFSAPDGSTNACSLIDDATNGVHRFQQNSTVVAGSTYVISFIAKAGSKSWCVIGENTFSSAAFFNLATGAMGAFTNCTPSITSLGGGQYLCQITYTQTGTVGRRYIGAASANNVASYVGSSAAAIYVFGAMFVAGVGGVYIPTTTAPVAVTDYTLTGPSVALGQVPVVGALLDWGGVAKR